MHLCTQTMPFEEPLDDTLSFLEDVGISHVDLHIDPERYLGDESAATELRATLDDHEATVDVLSALGPGVNPLHPDDDRADTADRRLRRTIELAGQLDVGTVTAFAGLPGGSKNDTTPTWITAMPPYPELEDAHSYQWKQAVDYWSDLAMFADAHSVDVAIEIHINTIVNTPPALVRLREATGDRIVGFLDTAHLYLQDIDPTVAISYLGRKHSLAHFEVADVVYETEVRDLHGNWSMPAPGAWSLATVGEGHDAAHWESILTALAEAGYEGPVSIQQLRTERSLRRGLADAAELLAPLINEQS